VTGSPSRARSGPSAAPRYSARAPPCYLLTWGLLGPGKGIEWTLRALAVAHRDATALARAIQRALSEPGPATRNVGSDRAAHAPTVPTLRWPAVAERYETLARRLVASGSTTAKAESA